MLSEFLVGAVEPVTEALGLSEFFLGIILIPLVGNAAEHFVAVQVASKNKMDLALSIAIGSSLQIALFVAPLLAGDAQAAGPRVLGVEVVVAGPQHAVAGVQQERGEDVQHPAEALDERGAAGDEDPAEHERAEHAEEQHAVLAAHI